MKAYIQEQQWQTLRFLTTQEITKSQTPNSLHFSAENSQLNKWQQRNMYFCSEMYHVPWSHRGKAPNLPWLVCKGLWKEVTTELWTDELAFGVRLKGGDLREAFQVQETKWEKHKRGWYSAGCSQETWRNLGGEREFGKVMSWWRVYIELYKHT